MKLPYHGGTGPLNPLIDSPGIKSEGEGEWNARKCHDEIAARNACAVIPRARPSSRGSPQVLELSPRVLQWQPLDFLEAALFVPSLDAGTTAFVQDHVLGLS